MHDLVKRRGDTVPIGGDYQFRAITQGNSVQRFWHENKKTCINRYLAPQASDYIVDVGCGSGVISSFLAESGAEIVGVDCNDEAIAFAQQKFSAPNLQFVSGYVDEQLQADKGVDKIYCLELIEHIYLDQAKEMLRNCARCLKPNGAVFLTTPNYHSPWPVIEWLMDTLSNAPQMAGEQHVELYNRRKMKQLCSDTGFELEVLATTCFLAPWLAPISRKIAEGVNCWETGRFLPGCILICVLRKTAL